MNEPREEIFAGFDGAPLALHRLGEGRPLILLHGLFSDARMNWIKFGTAERIAAKGYEVVMPDLRVHGGSAAPHDPAAYPADVLVQDLVALVGHLEIDDFDLGGFSLGARTILHAVAKGAVAPRRLVIGGMGVAGLAEWTRRAAFFTRVIDEFDTIEKGDPAWLAMQFLKSQKVDRVAARLLIGSFTDLPPDLLHRIQMPALVVCGAQDDDNGSAEALADLLPDATYAQVPGTHMTSVTEPELGRTIADWLARTEPSA